MRSSLPECLMNEGKHVLHNALKIALLSTAKGCLFTRNSSSRCTAKSSSIAVSTPRQPSCAPEYDLVSRKLVAHTREIGVTAVQVSLYPTQPDYATVCRKVTVSRRGGNILFSGIEASRNCFSVPHRRRELLKAFQCKVIIYEP